MGWLRGGVAMTWSSQLIKFTGPLVDIGGFNYPGQDMAIIPTTAAAFSTHVLDADGEKVGFVFSIGKTGTLNKVGFRTSTVTTGDDLKISFQDVDATNGDPDGTADQFRVITIADGDDDQWNKTGIISSDGSDSGTKRAVTAGDLLAIVIEFDSFVAGNLQITTSTARPYVGNIYSAYDSGAGYVVQSNRAPIFALEYDDGSYAYLPVLPAANMVRLVYTSATTPDEVGNRFTAPVKMETSGAWFMWGLGAGDTGEVILYDADDVALQTTSYDTDNRSLATESGGMVFWPAKQTLNKDAVYRIVIKPLSANSNALGTEVTVDTAAVLDQMGGGQNMHKTERTNSGAWTDTTTKRMAIGPIISAI